MKEDDEEALRQSNGIANGHAKKREILNLHNKEEESDQEERNLKLQRQSTSKTSNHSKNLQVEKQDVEVEKIVIKLIEEKNREFEKKVEVD